ncbi:hypothetical protein Taro_052812, partial [Colocasia esculenta]|nr:hypothetical protein [Colocasia esculenta]
MDSEKYHVEKIKASEKTGGVYPMNVLPNLQHRPENAFLKLILYLFHKGRVKLGSFRSSTSLREGPEEEEEAPTEDAGGTSCIGEGEGIEVEEAGDEVCGAGGAVGAEGGVGGIGSWVPAVAQGPVPLQGRFRQTVPLPSPKEGLSEGMILPSNQDPLQHLNGQPREVDHPRQAEFRVSYPRLVREFYKNLTCTDEGYESKVKGIAIKMQTDKAASIFKVPDEGANYHEFEVDLHEAYSILAGLPADASDPKQTFVTRFNANSFPPILRVIHHILTTIVTPQGGGRDRLTDIQRFIIYCMVKDIKINLHVILYQIISETTRKDLKRSLPYAAHLTSVFQHFGVLLENEKSQSIPKSNIYTFKNIQKFMGFRLEGNQIRRGPVVVEAPPAQEEQPQDQGEQPQAQEDQPQVQGDQPQAQEEQPPAEGDQPQGQEDQPPVNKDQPQLPTEGDIPFHAPISPQLAHFSPQHNFQPSTSFGGPSVPPELFSFLNEKFETLNSSIQTMSTSFELRIQRLENTVSAKFIEQKAASDYAAQMFNRLIGTMADASLQLKEHQQKLETVQTFLQKMCRHTLPWCRHNNTDSKAKGEETLRLCRHKSRVCRHELQFFRNQSTQVDTLLEQIDTGSSSQNSQFAELGQQVDTLSEQRVDTTTRADRHTTESLKLKVDGRHVSAQADG